MMALLGIKLRVVLTIVSAGMYEVNQPNVATWEHNVGTC